MDRLSKYIEKNFSSLEFELYIWITRMTALHLNSISLQNFLTHYLPF